MSILRLFDKRFVLIWLIAATLTVAGFLFIGLGAFIALFFIFHLLITAVPFSPKLANQVLGNRASSYLKPHLDRLCKSLDYRIFFFLSNVVLLSLAIYASLFVRFKFL